MSRIAPAWGLCLALLWSALALGQTAPAEGKRVLRISIDGAIGPATSTYVDRAIDAAHEQQAACLIIQLDTPGGLLESTKRIVQSFLGSPVPTVVYVAPSGATATSAGCFVVMAADVAAMAPATTIGAAHPVQIGAGGSAPPDEVMKKKLENYAASYIEAIASRHHRNAQWAVSAVRESASISSEQALEQKVIEIVASDVQDLLKQVDGREFAGRRIDVGGAQVVDLPMTTRERTLQVIGTPEVMFILLMIAMYGIIGELSSPGAILPGVAGVIAIILMLYISATLPMNMAGIALIAVAVGLFIADVFAPSHGVLTGGAIIAFLLGAWMLFDRTEPMLRLSLWLIVPATAVTAAFFLFVIGAGLRAQWLPHRAGMSTMIGTTGMCVTPIGEQGGQISIEGEYWQAQSSVAIPAGSLVRILASEGLRLTVEPTEKTKEPPHG